MVFLLIIAVVSSSMVSFSAANLFALNSGDKVVITAEEYQNLKATEKKFEKAVMLQEYIEENYYKDTSKVDFEDGVLKGLFEALDDPYSVYMNAEDFKKFSEEANGEYAGIGLYVTPGQDGFVEVVSPLEDTPAERAGLQPKDKILKVDGKEVSAKKYEEAVKMMRGKPGTKVTITVYREGVKQPFDVKLVRELIKVKAVKSEVKSGQVGYIKINSFDGDVAKEFKSHLDGLKAKGIKGLVLDLRGNPGGDLNECVKIADQLLGEGLIVFTKERNGKKEEFRSDAARFDKPIAVLIDDGSASASEILTGALKDLKAAKVYGTKSYGKGIVQSVIPLRDGSALKLTTSEYFTPSGKNIHKIGIEPHVAVTDDEKTKADEVLDRAMKELFK